MTVANGQVSPDGGECLGMVLPSSIVFQFLGADRTVLHAAKEFVGRPCS